MTALAEQKNIASALLDAEWDRMHCLLELAEAVRTGDTLNEVFSDRFQAVSDEVEAARAAGAWHGLVEAVPRETLDELTRLDVDLLVLALAPVARPTLAPRIQSLQPQVAQPWPALPLAQELLMVEGAADVTLLFDRLHPTAPLVATGLLKVEGSTPSQIIRPGPLLIKCLLGRDAELAPPPGATLSDRRGRWDQLILPATTLRHLQDFTDWVEHAKTLIRDWGAQPIHGPLGLFSGASGTGKTFAASVIAASLSDKTGERWSLYTLDLGRIMSKYVGETEANLNALLDALEGRNALLQIDEADGLLGKRGEVSDARDRYANLEVSHMLSRFERHVGPVILTTNLRSNVDAAFLRRFQMVVDFPAPDASARGQLWQVLLPPDAPKAERLDLAAVGEAVRLSGGSIQNAANYASVLAAAEGVAIDLPHIARAAWAELTKDSRQVRKNEIGFLREYLEDQS
ncbi:MAG: ATP-binding protein [Rhodobacteraceae bacterium]|nr:ATP-binding protein [Paracoccaceae bacterium]